MEHLPQKVWTDIPNIGDLDGIGRDELRALVESLNKSRMDLEARRFVESSLAKFASVVRFNANDNLKTWATRVLDEIVATADGLQACLYITDSENPNVLALAASHAFDSDRLDAQVPMGAGLLGQAAKSQKVYHFTEEADIATRTQTGLSVIRPRSVLIQPLVFGETVEGVLEINSLRVFGNEKLELIRLLAENIAANLMSIKNQEKMRHLFYEAQQRTEELMAQEEEMRQNMEELEATQEEMRRVQIELNGQISALNNAAIVSEADLKGDIIYANEQFCTVSKYSKEELLGRNHRILKSGTQPQELFEDLWATIGAGKVWRGTICNRAKDGSFYWVQSVITPVLGADKKPVKYIGVRFEITQLKKQEEQIRLALENAKSQEETFRRRLDELKANDSRRFIMERVLENLDVGVLITDAGGKPVFANATASEILGRGVRPDATLDDLACVYELYSETDACPYPAERLPLSLALSGNASRANDVVVRRENDALPISISGIPITDETGAVAYAVAIVSPRESRPSPTDLGKSVLSSDFANQCLQGVINASNETFFAIDREYRVILANETIKKKYKDAGKDEIAPGTSVWELLPAEDHDYHRTHFSRALSGESFVLPVRYADAKGGELDFDVNYYPLKDENGNVFGAAIHARTAHERKTDERRYRSAVALIEAAFAAPQKAAMLLDSNFNVEYATESARALLHAKSKEQDGAVFGLEKIVSNPEDWGELATTLKKFGYVETSVGTPAGVARIRLVPAQTGYLAVFEF